MQSVTNVQLEVEDLVNELESVSKQCKFLLEEINVNYFDNFTSSETFNVNVHMLEVERYSAYATIANEKLHHIQMLISKLQNI